MAPTWLTPSTSVSRSLGKPSHTSHRKRRSGEHEEDGNRDHHLEKGDATLRRPPFHHQFDTVISASDALTWILAPSWLSAWIVPNAIVALPAVRALNRRA